MPPPRAPPLLTPAQTALAASIVVAQHAQRAARRHAERKRELLTHIPPDTLRAFVRAKRPLLLALQNPVRMADDRFWQLADFDRYLLWDNFRDPRFWHLLVAVAAEDAFRDRRNDP